MNGELSMKDALKIPRIAFKMASEQADHPRAPTFTSNKPGDDGKSGSSSSQPRETQSQREQDQQQDQQYQQRKAQEKSKQQEESKQQGGQEPPKRFDSSDTLTWVITAALLYPFYSMLFSSESSREITWQELRKNFLDRGLVEKLVVSGDRVRV